MSLTNVITRDTGGPGQLSLVFNTMFALRATLDPPSVPSLSAVKDTVTFTGVKPGDVVFALSVDGRTNGLVIRAEVAAPNSVDIWYSNVTAASLDLAPMTLRLVIGRPTF